MNTYFDLVPSEIKSIIISYIDTSFDVENLIDLNRYSISEVNWNYTFFLHFGYSNKCKDTDLQKYLRYLDIHNLKEEFDMKEDIDNIYDSETFKLSYKFIKIFPAEIKSLINLKTLDLHYNDIKNIPIEIGNLQNLYYLNLGYNKIGIIPSEIGNLINLKDLFLNNNEIETIPPKIRSLVRLEYLNLSNNKIRSLPHELSNLINLKHFKNGKIKRCPIS